MIAYLSPGYRWVVGVVVGVVVAGVASAQQVPPSVQLFGPDGRAIGSKGETVQVHATGRVLDAETQQPLPVFHLTTGTQDRERTGFDWTETNRLLFTNGAFTVSIAKARLAPAVLIEADGYLPQCSGPIRGLETNMIFLLKKGSGPSGVVLTPDGRPAAGRTVYFSRSKDVVVLEGPTMTPKSTSPGIRTTVTSDAGRFSFAPVLDPFAVVVADDSGFAQVRVEDLKTMPEVRLQPWARVEGRLKIGKHPGANESIRVVSAFPPSYPRPLPPCLVSNQTTTDGEGRFEFSRVPPLDLKIFQVLKMGRGDSGLVPLSQITNLTLQGGETRSVTLGGQGRLILGHVILKHYSGPVEWQNQVFWLEKKPPVSPEIDAIRNEYRGAISAARSQQDKEAAQERLDRQSTAWYASAAGRQYWFSKRLYALKFNPDGFFRIDDVPPGKYQLTIDLRELAPGMGQSRSPLLALRILNVEVPDFSSGQTNSPCDFGAITMVPRLNPGAAAPDFTFTNLDGKSLKLSDFKGKYVLLNFWTMSNAPSVAEMPNLKESYAAFKNDPRLVMIGLNLDADVAAARAFSSENHLDWIQGFLGKWSESEVPDCFGVQDIPLVMLIDKDGHVMDNGLSGGTIKSTVDATLSDHPQ